jgi:SAM-dependent MidA family methyltransferase
MEWVLHDPSHGAYGAGHLHVGPRGDFATAPSLGPEFATLLVPQLAQWLKQLARRRQQRPSQPRRRPMALVEAGPGEGELSRQIAEMLVADWPDLAALTELVLVEPNEGMAARQVSHLRDLPLPCRWASFSDLAADPPDGVVLAHEVLDALPVERIVRHRAAWCRQNVSLGREGLHLEAGEPLPATLSERLVELGLLPLSPQRPHGWCTELHPGLDQWLATCGSALRRGVLLVVDYAMEARRYYAPHRRQGTLMAYRGQRASTDPLLDPGHWDLTAHLCVESLERAALAAGWEPLGQRRQGEALLALGLAQRLHGLQRDHGTGERRERREARLAQALARREALLRLVDPLALGDFRWLAFRRGWDSGGGAEEVPLFLRDSPPMQTHHSAGT